MTHVLDILSDDFPHGTVTGFANGCRTNHCPSPISCAVFDRRYRGDWGFRKRVDAGWTVVQIVDAENAEAAQRAQAERDANRAIRKAMRQEHKRKKIRNRYTYGEQIRPTPKPYTDSEVARIVQLNADGMTDTQIAAAMGRPFGSLTAKRTALGLPRNKPKTVIPHGTYAGYAAGCRDSCCHEPAKAYWRANAEAKRRRDGVPMKEVAA